ncbi:MAG: hypothetical protein WCS42_05850 [Verrucomicrobiota bacterium]
MRKTFQYAQSHASCRKFPTVIENCCGQGSGQKVCMTKRKTTATDLKKPIGVAQWQTKLVESLPKNLKGSLPTVAEIEAELDRGRSK